MLTHQGLGARTFAPNQSLDDMDVIMMGPQTLLARVYFLKELRFGTQATVEDSGEEPDLTHYGI